MNFQARIREARVRDGSDTSGLLMCVCMGEEGPKKHSTWELGMAKGKGKGKGKGKAVLSRCRPAVWPCSLSTEEGVLEQYVGLKCLHARAAVDSECLCFGIDIPVDAIYILGSSL